MPVRITRREFAARAAGLAAATCLPACAAPEEKKRAMPIIDPHQHLWDFRRLRPPWLKDEPKLNRSHTLEDYRKAVEGLDVVKTVYMEVDVAPEDQVAEAEYVIELS